MRAIIRSAQGKTTLDRRLFDKEKNQCSGSIRLLSVMIPLTRWMFVSRDPRNKGIPGLSDRRCRRTSTVGILRLDHRFSGPKAGHCRGSWLVLQALSAGTSENPGTIMARTRPHLYLKLLYHDAGASLNQLDRPVCSTAITCSPGDHYFWS